MVYLKHTYFSLPVNIDAKASPYSWSATKISKLRYKITAAKSNPLQQKRCQNFNFSLCNTSDNLATHYKRERRQKKF